MELKIAFIHNVYDRYNTLLNTIEIEKKYFPNSDIYILHNRSDIDKNKFKNVSNVNIIKFEGMTHKIGCVNGCITGFKEAIKTEYDIIIFSHDDVFIDDEYISVFNDNIDKIKNGVDFICRKPKFNWGDNYYMMEVFFISGQHASKVFNNITPLVNEMDIPKDIRGSISPEVYFHKIINNVSGNNLVYEYDHSRDGYNKTLGMLMGYHHKNIGIRAWKE